MKQTSWPEVPMINQKNYYTYVLLGVALASCVWNGRIASCILNGADYLQRLHEER
jgi:hypothetical protein